MKAEKQSERGKAGREAWASFRADPEVIRRVLDLDVSPRQRDVLLLMREGHTQTEIGRKLGVDPTTVSLAIRAVESRYGIPLRPVSIARGAVKSRKPRTVARFNREAIAAVLSGGDVPELYRAVLVAAMTHDTVPQIARATGIDPRTVHWRLGEMSRRTGMQLREELLENGVDGAQELPDEDENEDDEAIEREMARHALGGCIICGLHDWIDHNGHNRGHQCLRESREEITAGAAKGWVW